MISRPEPIYSSSGQKMSPCSRASTRIDTRKYSGGPDACVDACWCVLDMNAYGFTPVTRRRRVGTGLRLLQVLQAESAACCQINTLDASPHVSFTKLPG